MCSRRAPKDPTPAPMRCKGCVVPCKAFCAGIRELITLPHQAVIKQLAGCVGSAAGPVHRVSEQVLTVPNHHAGAQQHEDKQHSLCALAALSSTRHIQGRGLSLTQCGVPSFTPKP